MKKMWRIVTETKPIAFDPLRQDNAVAITIYIVEYDIGAVDVVASQTGQTPDSREAARRRLLEYAKKRILRKKYNYIFTGLNDQIYNLDLNMNFSFAASLSRFGGIYGDGAKPDMSIQAQQHAKNEANVANQMRETIDIINDAKDPEKIEKKIADTQKAIDNSTLSTETKLRYQNILKYQRNPNKLAANREIAASGGLNSDGSLSQGVREAKSLAEPVLGTNSKGENINLKFISDVNIFSPAAKKADEDMKTLREGKLRPVVFRESNQDANLGLSIDPNSDAGRQRTSSVFATALYSTLDASLQTLKLTIKGDPYWLFPRPVPGELKVLPYLSNMDPFEACNLIKFGHTDKMFPNTVNLFGTDNFIVVRFRTPRVFNLTDENQDPTDPNTEVAAFSGIYKVITIISKFEMGKFTQELSCILDPVIDLREFLKEIEISSGAPHPIKVPEVSPVGTDLQKQDRIAGVAGQIKGQPSTVQAPFGNIANTLTSNVPTTTPTVAQLISQTTTAAGKGSG
jgi:hypothetical protein